MRATKLVSGLKKMLQGKTHGVETANFKIQKNQRSRASPVYDVIVRELSTELRARIERKF